MMETLIPDGNGIFPCLSQNYKILAHHTDRLPLCVESETDTAITNASLGNWPLNGSTAT